MGKTVASNKHKTAKSKNVAKNKKPISKSKENKLTISTLRNT